MKHPEISEETRRARLTLYDPDVQLDSTINELNRLLRINFALRDDVVSFIEELPNRIRRIKTVTVQNHEVVKGQITGKVDWGRTIKSRYTQNPMDKTHFIVDRIEKNYNIPENIVLKEFLFIINTIIFHDVWPAIENKYPWLSDMIKEKRLKDVVETIYFKNIYVCRITEEEHREVSERMIANALRSRNSLYRDAASLLLIYRKMMS